MDETNIQLCVSTAQVRSIRETRNVYEIASGPCKSTLTFVGTFNANGSIVAPAIIYPDLRMPSDIAEQIPEEFYIGHSESRCMKSANFYEYIGNPFITWLNEHIIPKPVILFIDGHSSHLTFQVSTPCENNEIMLYLLPPTTTHHADVGPLNRSNITEDMKFENIN